MDDETTTPQRLGNLIGRELSTAVVMFHEAVGKRLGLSGTERKLLDVLARLGPSTAGELATHTGLTTGAITGVVDRLARAGYARREPNPRDRRSVIVTPLANPASERLRSQVFAPLGQAIADLSELYQPAELAAIASYLVGLTDILKEQTIRLHQETTIATE
ncbi:MAG TPA: MarR family transcriptional regulator [Streptosporangiaceae bacterium]|nr:MarR family transcriptional regulator [Streptosporangiaceae bacterium]